MPVFPPAKNKTLRSKNKGRLLALLFGTVIGLLLLETGLRIGGTLRARLRNTVQQQAMDFRGRNNLLVLCLGESTTAGQYPAMLEEELNNANSNPRFTVIDAGRAGISSGDIVRAAPELISKFRPDIVTIMMGCNDGDAAYERSFALMRKIKVFALARMLWWRLSAATCFRQGQKTQTSDRTIEEYAQSTRDFDRLCACDTVYLLAEEFIPDDNPEKESLKLKQTEDFFRQRIKNGPRPETDRLTLAFLYYYYGRHAKACKELETLQAAGPLNCTGWLVRASSLAALADKDGSLHAVSQAVAKGPETWWDFEELADELTLSGDYTAAEGILHKAIKIFPDHFFYYTQLATLSLLKNDYQSARNYSQKAASLAPDDNRAWKKLALASLLASERYADGPTINDFPLPKTAANYKRLVSLLQNSGAVPVCVQYPMRSLLPLQAALAGHPGLLFVDNSHDFLKEVQKLGFGAIFKDAFAGDFGHCTQRGNRIIAQNIAREILKHITVNQ